MDWVLPPRCTRTARARNAVGGLFGGGERETFAVCRASVGAGVPSCGGADESGKKNTNNNNNKKKNYYHTGPPPIRRPTTTCSVIAVRAATLRTARTGDGLM